MRQPALLLHDRTIAPSTYDKEAISQWLAEHRSEQGGRGRSLFLLSGAAGREAYAVCVTAQSCRKRS